MASTVGDDFTVISTSSELAVGPDYEEMNSAKHADFDISFVKTLRKHFPELTVTTTFESELPCLAFADVEPSQASYELDIKTDSIFRYRDYWYYGELGETRVFSKYHYRFGDEHFILFLVSQSYYTLQCILKEPNIDAGESTMSNCAATDSLLRAVGLRFEDHSRPDPKFVYLFDRGYWMRSKELWNDIHESTWDKVILAKKMKKDLTGVTSRFFDSKHIYRRYGVQWKRGIILYGPPGNGKTISIKALMRDLAERERPIASLYVKAADETWHIEEIFSFARYMTPCFLILEDIDSIVNEDTRSYFFNEMDGLADNDGILTCASTNFINKLDPGLAARPSRFDRKFRFPLPNFRQRVKYARFWRKKLEKRAPTIDFPEILLKPMAQITGKFSFAFIQEAFIAALLQMARDDEDNGGDNDDDSTDSEDEDMEFSQSEDNDDEIDLADSEDKDGRLDEYHLWRAFKFTVETLRKDLQHRNSIGLSEDEAPKKKEAAATSKDPSKSSKQFADESNHLFSAKSSYERMEFMPLDQGGKWVVRAPGQKIHSRGKRLLSAASASQKFRHGAVSNDVVPSRAFDT